MTSNIFFQNGDSDITATVKNECWTIQWSSKVFYCSCCDHYLLSSMLKPFGYSVSDFRIQKFSLSISRWVRVYFDLDVFVAWSIMVNFACLLKLCVSCWKCLQAIIASTFFTSFRRLFSLLLKLVSDVPTHCLLHKCTPSNI